MAFLGIKGRFEKADEARDKFLKTSPTYERPEEVNQIVSMYRDLSSQQNAPGYYMQQQLAGAEANQAMGNLQDMAVSSASSLGGLSDIYRKEMASLHQARLQSNAYIADQQNNYANALGQSAMYDDLEYQYNQVDPYQRQLAAMGASIDRDQERYNRFEKGFNKTVGKVFGALVGGI